MHSKMLVAVAAALVSTGAFAVDVKSVSRLAFGHADVYIPLTIDRALVTRKRRP